MSSHLDEEIRVPEVVTQYDPETGLLSGVVVEGLLIPAINGEISQRILGLKLRMEEAAKRFKALDDELEAALILALQRGVPAREGPRLPTLRVVERSSPPYKSLFVEAMGKLGTSEKDALAEAATRATKSTSTSLVIRAIK